MLSVSLKGDWQPLEPETIAGLILDGELDRSTPVRDPARSETECLLEQAMSRQHFEELSGALLRRLQRLYLPGSRGTDPVTLRDRVAVLTTWSWQDPVVAGRMLWTAAWLEEVTGRLERAVQCYDAFLRQDVAESHLRLLAFANRGALRIRLGEAEGVLDIARAAIMMYPGQPSARQPDSLPAACFNLLNLLNLAARSEILRDAVEPVLIDYMVSLPKTVRGWWLGQDPRIDKEKEGEEGEAEVRSQAFGFGKPTTGLRPREGAASDEEVPPQPGATAEDAKVCVEHENDRLRAKLRILSDDNYSRFNRLTSNLAARAQRIAPAPFSEGQEKLNYHEVARHQLCLWIRRPEVDVAGDPKDQTTSREPALLTHDKHAEAASLLYARDVPAFLTPGDQTIVWTERLAQDCLNRAEECLAAGDFDSAQDALESAAGAVYEMEPSERVDTLRERIDLDLQQVRRRRATYEQHRLYQACSDAGHEVDTLCNMSSLYEAQRAAADLEERIRQLRDPVVAAWGEGCLQFLAKLEDRIGTHVRDLHRRDVEGKVEAPRGRLTEKWPRDWKEPVPEEAYQALDDCRLNDPGGLVENWDRLKSQLDAHKAQYEFQRTLRNVASRGVDRQQVEASLGRVLSLDPDLGSAAAPIFGLLSLTSRQEEPLSLAAIRDELLRTVQGLLETQPLGADGVWSTSVRADLIRRACSSLKRLCRAFLDMGRTVADLWQELAGGFDQALAEGRPEMIEEIEEMIHACLEACPDVAGFKAMRVDPRNALRILLEQCEKSKLLGSGERAQNARPPELGAAAEFFAQVLDLGVSRCEHFRRAVTGLYLSRIGVDDPPPLQRRVLDALDAWVDSLSDKDLARGAAGDVVEKVDEVKRELGFVPSPDDEPSAELSDEPEGELGAGEQAEPSAPGGAGQAEAEQPDEAATEQGTVVGEEATSNGTAQEALREPDSAEPSTVESAEEPQEQGASAEDHAVEARPDADEPEDGGDGGEKRDSSGDEPGGREGGRLSTGGELT